ncbi:MULTISPECIES: hypothetical protein [Niastella]|uniref:DUF4595 domain-containing protein n=1 Tax=Niastella soli TaxID=2821487 RepID=A0ABS3YND2_9BACT|nr:hypothetical protein [Niastella soli]MBO9199394.1 hypothetical protein [Niastella soli]
MKIKRIMPVSVALCIIISCSKKDSSGGDPTPPGPKIDSSKCLLTEVNYETLKNAPYYNDNFTITYDSLKRVIRKEAMYSFILYSYEPGKVTLRSYINKVADSNLASRAIYTLDNNGRITDHENFLYKPPTKSENDFWRQDKTLYEYNGDGYLTGLKTYAFGKTLSEETKLTYQNGNLTQRENIHYEYSIPPYAKLSADTINFTYDNTPWYPEASYLYEINDYRPFKTDKPNKNNVTGVQSKVYGYYGTNLNWYKSIQYVYSAKGPRLEKATMTATTTNGQSIITSISFGFKCD